MLIKNGVTNSKLDLDYLIDPVFQGLDRLFTLSFENKAYRSN